ncbi:MAG: phenylacetic acid degradation protein PaaN [Stappiaceae bacterium]
MSELFENHQAMLNSALVACGDRSYFSAFLEIPSGKIYGETAKADGEAWFKDRMNGAYALAGHPGAKGAAGKESSPFGPTLGVTYPKADVGTLISAAEAAAGAWGRAPIETRIGVCLEALVRINMQSFAMANAVMHTTGQAFAMAFQAGGPHAQDRGLEAVAYAYQEMTRTPASALWTKPQGKRDPLVMEKNFRVIPRGLSLVIGCATFPTWNTYPALFASLACGNPVIIKPHPDAILPLALTVEILRDVLTETGFDPNVVLLAVDEKGAEITQEIATHPAIKTIDFTGSNGFARWLKDNVDRDTALYTEEAGVNSIVIASSSQYRAMCDNIAFSISLYSGQMCTAPQNIYVPAGGIESDEGPKSFDAVAADIGQAVDRLLSDPDRAAAISGAIANPATVERVKQAVSLGTVVRASTPVEGAGDARTATPLVMTIDDDASEAHKGECFGPVCFVVKAADADSALKNASGLAREKGAITAAVYAQDEATLDRAVDAFAEAGVALSCNLTGQIFVNQSAAFSDYHVSGANPAGNACLTDAAFVAGRFRIAPSRRLKAA